ncbi:aspartic peptidase domain-containing protein [Rhodocollybia butyracea]|uniref:Aspartic peptidase domain-containing protein n=1 Tax=Rhodocollybia butyracea TaxID=206335 RepID=A0A9P5UGW1_9AGAR|nr:aspartic peptidase domain-containing protein [Rhodocollybia butyracea]
MVSSSSLFPLALLVCLRTPEARTIDDIGAWARAHKLNVEAKYGNPSSISKRAASGQNLIFFRLCRCWYPPVAYEVILDTGSSDLWLAASTCKSKACSGIASFNPSSSSTFQNLSKPFSITYGSGEAAGSLGQDVVQMAGFSVSNQIFAVCDQVSEGLLNEPVSGLIGLAFSTIANAWTQPLMAFQLTRFNNATQAKDVEPGGTFTMGAVNTSLYTGDIDYNPIPNDDVSYWLQSVSSITSQGNSIPVQSGTDALAAIDTGTTLHSGSEAGTGDMEGYYTYPCSTPVQVTMAFGGQSWPISPADFEAQDLGGNTCMGAFFSLETGSNTPAWIVGDTFLKNVYSVFRFNPPSVGFAQLSSTALAMNGVNAPPPSPTIGSAAATVSATGTVTGSRETSSNDALSTISSSPLIIFYITMAMLSMLLA